MQDQFLRVCHDVANETEEAALPKDVFSFAQRASRPEIKVERVQETWRRRHETRYLRCSRAEHTHFEEHKKPRRNGKKATILHVSMKWNWRGASRKSGWVPIEIRKYLMDATIAPDTKENGKKSRKCEMTWKRWSWKKVVSWLGWDHAAHGARAICERCVKKWSVRYTSSGCWIASDVAI